MPLSFNEFFQLPERKVLVGEYYVRLYRDNGKLRLEALREPMVLASEEQHLQLEIFGHGQVRIHIYLDGVERDFRVLKPLQRKIADEFIKRFVI